MDASTEHRDVSKLETQFMTLLQKKTMVAGLTQADVAREMDLSQVAVNRWYKGHARPAPKHVKKLAAILDITREQLVDVIIASESASNQPSSE